MKCTLTLADTVGMSLRLKKCLICEKPYQFYCKACRKESEEQIHYECK